MSKTPPKSPSKRIDFDSDVPEILFRKTGGHCSVPRCTNPTTGPFQDRLGAVNMGTACHIYSAAENGPRGWGGKDADFIRSEKNGIWCCSYHGTLIDKSKGSDYPATVLFAWKDLAEARQLKKMYDSPSPLGWVESIEFSEFPVLKALPKVTLSRRTLLWGANGSGKTSLLEAAASISHSRYAERFNGTRIRNAAGGYDPALFRAKVTYSTVDTLSKVLNLDIVGIELTRRAGAVPYLLPPGDLEVIYFAEDDRYRRKDEDDVDYMTRVLNIDKGALFALAKLGANSLIPGQIKIEQAMDYADDSDDLQPVYKSNGDPYYELSLKIAPRADFLPYGALSGSEQGRLLLDLLITKAREISKQRLTLLLIDSLPMNFDSGNFEALLRILGGEEFQVLVVLPPDRNGNMLLDGGKPPSLKALDYLESWKLATL